MEFLVLVIISNQNYRCYCLLAFAQMYLASKIASGINKLGMAVYLKIIIIQITSKVYVLIVITLYLY